jgi:exodeoxyribonuclease-3
VVQEIPGRCDGGIAGSVVSQRGFERSHTLHPRANLAHLETYNRVQLLRQAFEALHAHNVTDNAKMRIVEWNCNMAFRKKATRILTFNPDLLIVPECECLERLKFPLSMPQPRYKIWIGDNHAKGIGIFSYSDLEITLHEAYDSSFRYVVPIKVNGSKRFNLLAIWAMNDENDQRRRYIGQVWLAAKRYESLLDDSILITGDFNWNQIWDGSPDLYGNLTQTVEFLQSKGIVSLYHTFFQEAFGQESRPTLYMYRKASRPYHIDYCFASADFVDKLQSVEVGSYADWQVVSDHMPVITTFKI